MPEPIFDPTTKSTHDVAINKKQAIEMKLVTDDEFDYLVTQKHQLKSIKKWQVLLRKAGFILADLKLEFGKINDDIILGDSIGPDEYRLWPKESYKIGEIQEAYDKQLLRDWLTANGYQKQFDDARSEGKEPM